MPKHPKKANDESFEEFYARHRSLFEKRLSRFMSAHDAEDLAQDVFMAVWKAQQVKKCDNLFRFVARACKNARVNLWRKEKTRRNYEERFEPVWEVLQAPPPGVESAALRAEQIRLLRELRKERPEAYRAYLLREYGELNYVQIATVMGIGRNKAAKLAWIGTLKMHSAEAKEGNACVR